MTLDPRDRKSWHGFLDLLQPPVGFRLAAAVGTTFGLSVEALTAALLAMSDTDGEALANEPVAGVMAITRLRARVRVLVHPATIAGNSKAGASRFVALLDRLIVQVQPGTGLFHPKVWALRFEKVGSSQSSEPNEVARLIVCSRNLSSSTSFELASVFEGKVADDGEAASPFSVEVADALQAWMTSTEVRVPAAVWHLPPFLRQLSLEVPHEASTSLRFRWQGQGRQSLATALPQRLERAVIVSPFVRPDFVSAILSRTNHLQLVSTPESLDALDDATFARLEALRESQGSPVLYQVTDHGDPEGGYIDGLHAKLLLTEDSRHKSTTYVGSANATGPGWGLSGAANVEAMAEMRPGIGIDRFVSGFLRESKSKVHPWVMEYDRAAKVDPDPSREAERQMLAALREVAKLDLVLRYDAGRQRLTLSRASKRALASVHLGANADLQFDFAPLLLNDRQEAWRQIQELASGDCHFDEVPLEKLTAFVALRARSKEPPLERTRLLLARLEVAEADLDLRDDAVRQDIMATADPAAVLNALVRGLAHLRTDSTVPGRGSERQTPSIRQLLGETSLERLLQAVALEPSLISEMRLLLGPIGGSPFQRLCDDLEEVIQRVRAEAAT